MSNPFYGLTPVYLPYSGTTDANGNFRTTLQPRAGFWFTGKLINEVASGFPAVRVSDGAIPLGFGRGIRAEVAGLVAPPGASLVVDVIGANPSIAVKGSLVGIQGPDMTSIVQAISPSPNTVAVDVASPSVLLGNVQVLANGVLTTNFVLPTGTIAVGYIVDNSGSFINPLTVSLSGVQTLITYLNDTQPFPGLHSALVPAGVDTSIALGVTGAAGGPARVFLIAFTAGVLQAVGQPTLWQGPTNRAYVEDSAGAGPFNVIAGVAGQRIRVFGWMIAVDTAAGFGSLYDASLAATSGRIAVAFGTGITTGFHAGVPLAVGASLAGDKGAAAQTVRWAVSYSIG